MAQLSRQRLAVLLALAVAAAGVIVAVALHSSDEPVRAAAASTGTAAPLSGLPLVALPPVTEATADDRLGALQALATKDPTRSDVQMAIGSEQLVRGDGTAATAAFTAAKKLGDPAADVALIVAGYNPKTPDATVSRLELLAATSPFARYELGVVQLWAGRLAQATAALKAVRDADSGVVLRRQGRRPDASHHAARLPAVRAGRPAAGRRHDRLAEGRGRRRSRRREGASCSGAPRCRPPAIARRRWPCTARR